MLNEIESLRMSSWDILKFIGDYKENLTKVDFNNHEEILKDHQGYVTKMMT